MFQRWSGIDLSSSHPPQNYISAQGLLKRAMRKKKDQGFCGKGKVMTVYTRKPKCEGWKKNWSLLYYLLYF